jgi:hypothetical protein
MIYIVIGGCVLLAVIWIIFVVLGQIGLDRQWVLATDIVLSVLVLATVCVVTFGPMRSASGDTSDMIEGEFVLPETGGSTESNTMIKIAPN